MDATFESAARRRALWTALGVFGAIVVCVLFLDRPVAWLAHGLGRPGLLVWLTWIADVPVPTSVLGLAACGVAWLAGWRHAVMRVVFARVRCDAGGGCCEGHVEIRVRPHLAGDLGRA